MANRFLSNIRINDAYTFPASDGNDGQVITTDGAGNLAFENVSPDAASVIYRDNFTGDGSTVIFDLQNSITDEDQTQIYIDGVYQEKSTYSISGTTITFTTAPILGHSVEVISISSINTGPTILYQDNFTGNGNDTAFTLGQIIDNEIKTFIFLNGVYQFKNTYTLDGTTLTFDTAPANGVSIEVISIASATQSDSLQAGAVIIPVKNTHTASISKGTPVYITGNVGASERLQIAPADASNSAKMPAAGLLLTTLAVNELGYAITGGYLRNLTTDTIDGTSTSSNDTVYVKAGGGLTMTKPTGSNLIQNIAKVARSASGSAGSLIVSSILRTNDIPNLTTGKIWVGSANNTIESGTLHLDESNNRLGINNNNPSYSLDVTGDANISSNVIVGGNLTVQGTETILNTQTVEVEDNILQLNTTQGSPDTATATTSGISIYRGSGVTQASFIFDDADDTWDLTDNLVIAGNVGIGKTPSTWKLDVDSSDIYAASFDTSNNVGIVINGNNTTAAQIIGYSNSASTYNELHLRANSTTTDGLYINSFGNVGIGNTSPSRLLSISDGTGGGDPTDSRTKLYVDASTEAYMNFNVPTNSYTGIRYAIAGTNKAFMEFEDPNDYLKIGTISSDSVIFSTTNTERMRITSGGEIQIKGGDLSIQGGTNYNDKSNIYLSNGRTLIQSDIVNLTANGDTSLDFQTRSGGSTASAMFIDEFRNVGIGYTSPLYKLDVYGTSGDTLTARFKAQGASTDAIVDIESERDCYLRFRPANTNKWSIVADYPAAGDLDIYNYPNNFNAMTFKENYHITTNMSGGNFGIGTTSPKAKLDVGGDVNTTGYLANTLEFSTYFGSGTTVIATLNGNFESGTTAVASIEYVGLYAYAGTSTTLGLIMAATRRSNNNTAWTNVNDETIHVAGSTGSEPTLYWDNGVLKITVGSSVQISCRIRITYHGSNTGLTRNHSA